MSLAVAPIASATADMGVQVEPFGSNRSSGIPKRRPIVFLVWGSTAQKHSEGGENTTAQGEPLEAIDVFSYEGAENETAQEEPFAEIIKALFKGVKGFLFEDGMETEFSKELVRLVKRYGKVAMEVITALIVNENVDAEAAAEALRWLGRMDHLPSYRDRLWLLERSLFCSSAQVRDGAALGLASLDDPHAIPYLQRAIEQEKCVELRQDLEQVLEQLESTRQCHFS